MIYPITQVNADTKSILERLTHNISTIELLTTSDNFKDSEIIDLLNTHSIRVPVIHTPSRMSPLSLLEDKEVSLNQILDFASKVADNQEEVVSVIIHNSKSNKNYLDQMIYLSNRIHDYPNVDFLIENTPMQENDETMLHLIKDLRDIHSDRIGICWNVHTTMLSYANNPIMDNNLSYSFMRYRPYIKHIKISKYTEERKHSVFDKKDAEFITVLALLNYYGYDGFCTLDVAEENYLSSKEALNMLNIFKNPLC